MTQKNPWTTVNTRSIYRNPWIHVREDSVLRPDGSPGIYGVVEMRVATGVVALTDKLEVYLVGQFRYPTHEYSWEIIEGGAEVGEDPLVAAKRELGEEAGLVASEWRDLGGEIHLSNCVSNEIARLFIATGLSETSKSPDVTEVLEIRRVPFVDAVAMVDRGEIKDAMSIMGILRAEKILAKKSSR